MPINMRDVCGLVRRESTVRITSAANTAPMIGTGDGTPPSPSDVGLVCTYIWCEDDSADAPWTVMGLRAPDGRYLVAVNADLDLVTKEG